MQVPLLEEPPASQTCYATANPRQSPRSSSIIERYSHNMKLKPMRPPPRNPSTDGSASGRPSATNAAQEPVQEPQHEQQHECVEHEDLVCQFRKPLPSLPRRQPLPLLPRRQPLLPRRQPLPSLPRRQPLPLLPKRQPLLPRRQPLLPKTAATELVAHTTTPRTQVK